MRALQRAELPRHARRGVGVEAHGDDCARAPRSGGASATAGGAAVAGDAAEPVVERHGGEAQRQHRRRPRRRAPSASRRFRARRASLSPPRPAAAPAGRCGRTPSIGWPSASLTMVTAKISAANAAERQAEPEVAAAAASVDLVAVGSHAPPPQTRTGQPAGASPAARRPASTRSRREVQEQVEDREAEEPLLGPVAVGLRRRLVAPPDPPGAAQEERVQDQRPGEIDRPADRGEGRRHRHRRQHQRVGEDLVARRPRPRRHRQHRHAGAGVVLVAEERQRPEVRRGPEEDQREHQHALDRDAAGRRRPADHRRQRPGRAADHDVLRRRPLQPDRVDHRVEEDGEGEQPRRDEVGEEPQHHHREPGQRQPERQRLAALDPPRGDRPAGGAAHHRVDLPVLPHVERARRAGADGDADDRREADHRMQRHRRRRPCRPAR